MTGVSIHAPAWGATGCGIDMRHIKSSFNPRARVGRDPPVRRIRRGMPCFNPRARVGRDVLKCIGSRRSKGFNPRARVGRDLLILAVSRRWRLFQSTRPRGARQAIRPAISGHGKFQSTRPRGARPMRSTARAAMKPFQSTRPRGARREKGHGCRSGCDVSIHAPAWGATTVQYVAGYVTKFQSTRPRGARPTKLTRIIGGGTFQSTRPRGARRSLWSWYRRHAHVSIHAPAWGATPAGGRPSESPACFNPRARVGRDMTSCCSTVTAEPFQSTRPRGARLFR